MIWKHPDYRSHHDCHPVALMPIMMKSPQWIGFDCVLIARPDLPKASHMIGQHLMRVLELSHVQSVSTERLQCSCVNAAGSSPIIRLTLSTRMYQVGLSIKYCLKKIYIKEWKTVKWMLLCLVHDDPNKQRPLPRLHYNPPPTSFISFTEVDSGIMMLS